MIAVRMTNRTHAKLVLVILGDVRVGPSESQMGFFSHLHGYCLVRDFINRNPADDTVVTEEPVWLITLFHGEWKAEVVIVGRQD